MNKLDLFKYPLYPTEAEFSSENLNERVQSTLMEIKSLVPELFDSKIFDIQHTFTFDNNQMWLALAAFPSIQMSFAEFNVKNETILQFKKRILEQITRLPQRVHSILLDLETTYLSASSDQTYFTSNEVNFLQTVRNKRHDKLLFSFDGGQTSFPTPEFNSSRLDPQAREIQCSVHSLFRFHAVIDRVQDPYAPNITKSKKISLNFVNSEIKNQNFDSISVHLKQEKKLALRVKAVSDVLTNNIIEYQLTDKYA